MYIQNFSGDTDYSMQDGYSIKSSLANTGVNSDEKCKINDMASNAEEWTTEYCTISISSDASPCTIRGGSYVFRGYSTDIRNHYPATYGDYDDFSFRSALYM